MAQFGSDCAIDENVNNRLRIQTAPVRHSAGDIDDVSTQSYRHSAVRHRHRRTPDSDISNSTGLSTSELRSVGDLSPRFTDNICDWKVSSNGTPSPRVDTSDRARHQMTHTNGCRDTERRQTSSIDVKNADCNAVLAQTKDTPVRLLSDSNKNIGTSDGSAHDKSTRTLPSTLSNGAACVSNSVNAGSFPLLAINDVPVFDYSNPDSSRKDSARNSKILRRRSAIEYRKPNTSVSETSLNGFPAIEYTKSDGGTSAIGDARNEKKLVLRSESESALAKAGDFDREREIERRMRELGLWEYKREQERHLVEILDAQITQRDGLSAALHRCRRRQRGPSASAADDIRCQVNHHFVRSMMCSLTLLLTLSPPIPFRLYTLPYWSNPLFLVIDIRALWRSGLSARAPECQKLKIVG